MTRPSEHTPTSQLRFDILGGFFAPGERLVEVTLADRYSVGRSAIRAALVELRAEGLVDIEANRGAVVRKITLDEAIEIAEARQVLEGLIAGRAAIEADDQDKEALQTIIGEMRDAVATGDNSGYSELNKTLHRSIWEMSRHDTGIDLVANLRDRSAAHQYRLAMMPGRSEQSLEQHAAVVDAIVAGDNGKASVAMQEHLDSVIDVLRNWAGGGG